MNEKTIAEAWNTFTEEQRNCVYKLVGFAFKTGRIPKILRVTTSDKTLNKKDSLYITFNTLNEEQKKLVYELVRRAMNAECIPMFNEIKERRNNIG